MQEYTEFNKAIKQNVIFMNSENSKRYGRLIDYFSIFQIS